MHDLDSPGDAGITAVQALKHAFVKHSRSMSAVANPIVDRPARKYELHDEWVPPKAPGQSRWLESAAKKARRRALGG